MKPTDRNKYVNLVDKYNQLLTDYKNGTEKKEGDIYRFLQKVAKREYYKDAEFAQFQELFFQKFIKTDEYISAEYNEKLHDKLVALRDKADSRSQ